MPRLYLQRFVIHAVPLEEGGLYIHVNIICTCLCHSDRSRLRVFIAVDHERGQPANWDPEDRVTISSLATHDSGTGSETLWYERIFTESSNARIN